VPLSLDDIKALATTDPAGAVLSVVLRTDPRDPANTRRRPAWQVSLRTGLQDIREAAERNGSREDRMALRALQEPLQSELDQLPRGELGRGIAWFVTADRSLDRRHVFQLPPSREVVRWDARPYVAPLIEIVERGRPVALVLVASDAVRLLRWEEGRVDEPERSVYDLELGDWREYAGYAAANPARGQQTATHVESYEQRVDAWRRRFFRSTGATLARRLDELGTARALVAGDRGLTALFAELLPEGLAHDVIAETDVNLVRADPTEIAERFDETIASRWREDARRAAEHAIRAARAGEPAALGADETLPALAGGRVRQLIIDPDHDFAVARLGSAAVEALRAPADDMVAECAIELALATGAEIFSLRVAATPALAEAGGMAATLRY